MAESKFVAQMAEMNTKFEALAAENQRLHDQLSADKFNQKYTTVIGVDTAAGYLAGAKT